MTWNMTWNMTTTVEAKMVVDIRGKTPREVFRNFVVCCRLHRRFLDNFSNNLRMESDIGIVFGLK